ncbi:hypothetical protein ES702_07162 [subsurface metagenome]
MKLYLIGMDQDHSVYIRDLVNKDRLDRLDSIYIKKRREELQEEIKKLDESVKVSREDTDQVKQILEMAQKVYSNYTKDPGLNISNFKTYLRSNILPKLKKAHCNRYDVDSLLEMCATGGKK